MKYLTGGYETCPHSRLYRTNPALASIHRNEISEGLSGSPEDQQQVWRTNLYNRWAGQREVGQPEPWQSCTSEESGMANICVQAAPTGQEMLPPGLLDQPLNPCFSAFSSSRFTHPHRDIQLAELRALAMRYRGYRFSKSLSGRLNLPSLKLTP